MASILIAGIGNVFNGDDGFGVAVARELLGRDLPPNVRVIDFGIRGLDLAYALLDGYSAAILVDSAQRGEAPGTVSVIEPEPLPGEDDCESIALSPHAMDPVRVLRLVRLMGGYCRRIMLVGCEPQSFGENELGTMALSPAVAAAVVPAANTAQRLALALSRETLEDEVISCAARSRGTSCSLS
jgi:hydrogenase maturation protease